jgi:hypothetical protein
MYFAPEPFADEAQPGNPGMSGFRHRSLHVEKKDGKSPPPRVSLARYAAAQGLDRRVVLVGRPMTLEIVKECRPVMFEAMFIKIADRERKAVVDAEQRGDILGQFLY